MLGDGHPFSPRLVAGRYAILRELGRGGMGVVWLAEDRLIGRQVALKELRLPPGLSGPQHAAHLDRALREVRTAGRLNHPGVVTVYDVVTEAGAVHIVMELAQAPTLAELVAAEGPLDEDRVAGLALAVLDALRTAHAAGIVHRDVKPANIMVLPGDHAKLADFGIAQAMDDPGLTTTDGIMGSPGYMAPELFAGSSPAPASDLWSLGATMFHAVEGHSPFAKATTAATMHAIMSETPSLRRCQGPLAEVINGLLIRPVDERLTSGKAREMLLALTNGADQPTMAMIAPAEAAATVAGATTVIPVDATTARGAPAAGFPPPTTLPRPPWHDPTDPNTGPRGSGVAQRGDTWTAEDIRKSRRRRALLVGLIAVVVVAVLVPLLLFVNGQKPTPTAQSAPDRGTPVSTPGTPRTVASGGAPTTASTPGAPPTSGAGADATLAQQPVGATSGRGATSAAATPAPGGGAAPPPPPHYSLVPLTRYHEPNGYHYVTTPGHPPPAVNPAYVAEGTLGSLVATNVPGTGELWSCRFSGGHYVSQFLSLNAGCEGQTRIAALGWIFLNPPSNVPSAEIWRCATYVPNANSDYFVSLQSNCEGQHVDGPLGYLVE